MQHDTAGEPSDHVVMMMLLMIKTMMMMLLMMKTMMTTMTTQIGWSLVDGCSTTQQANFQRPDHHRDYDDDPDSS